MSDQDLYVVRLWDGFDGEWMDVTAPLPKEEAEKICGDDNEKHHGRRDGNYSDIDYYKVFPSDTVMHFNGSSPERTMR